MRVGIMQPYLFPYLGYYQLINAVDIFVVYDDVNFIKQGWINRNRILLNGSVFMFNLTVKGASSFKKINEIEIAANNHKLIKTIEHAYRKAPYFAEVNPVLTDIILNNETNLARYLINSIRAIVKYLDIHVSVVISSDLEKNDLMKSEDKVIDICKILKATNYINAIGGQELYSSGRFLENDLLLNFLKPKPIVYPQFKNNFIPCLSIIDVMMFNSPAEISKMLDSYELI